VRPPAAAWCGKLHLDTERKTKHYNSSHLATSLQVPNNNSFVRPVWHQLFFPESRGDLVNLANSCQIAIWIYAATTTRLFCPSPHFFFYLFPFSVLYLFSSFLWLPTVALLIELPQICKGCHLTYMLDPLFWRKKKDRVQTHCFHFF
jgi:hypothetical protein